MSADSLYYRGAARLSFARAISARARSNVFGLFMRQMRPHANSKILDIGSSDEEGPETNMLERLYPWPKQITAVGLGEGRVFSKRYASSYLQIEAGKLLPFADKAFDIAWSNAVLEHVGGQSDRAAFVAEIRRVSRRAFVIVPNRWFPIEHHTAIPLLHWSAPAFRYMLRGTPMSHWTKPRFMDFLSRRLLCREFPEATVIYAGFHLGPFSSNLALVFRDAVS
ncbi:MAG: methyltransferase domain-containing protein [Steroidobacteraceae bacterium]